MRQLLILACLFTIRGIIAQNINHEKISISLDYARHQYAMDSLNETYMNFNINETGWLEKNISGGQYFGISLGYRPKEYFDVGVKFAYQSGISSHKSSAEVYDNSPIPIETVRTVEVSVSSFSINPTISIYFSQLLNYFYPKENRRINYAIEVNSGLGLNSWTGHLSLVSEEHNYEYLSSSRFSNTALNTQIGLKLELTLSQSNLFSFIGFRGGYQFYKTGKILSTSGEEFVSFSGTISHLDFSGWYYGVYLKFGK
jgi:hypothetical protein